MITAKVISAMAQHWKLPARHGDVPNAYVKASAEEEFPIYIKTPQGMEIRDQVLKELGVNSTNEIILLLLQSLYGLKQAGRLWNRLLSTKLTDLGLKQSIVEPCLFYRKDGREILLVGIYVDELLVTGTNDDLVNKLFESLKILQIKDLGEVNKFLGTRIIKHEEDYFLDQEHLINDLLNQYGMNDAKMTKAPIDSGHLCDESSPKLHDPKNFRSLAGSLL
ncbi:FOG: Transposon-encoded proteins with TYA, reverse transcriptase, integrase domains in various combinations [Plasmopara halstedii]|uniref:FOG: Transposon-encoded proteins with TYA, reverse transcriptase, integrase domains in various combinations n=1 Tax=Plasmopara halstedii TaxID=4781 RepID=A0A0P1AV05_PLAHL|nr:FOG: Transposon-encoded proteins with TYA, reverse transcriptase, integrase domains in various combinations [Plasmopara halstedii]CEG45564.1 FOG: Transposon-encoded proteins with TYA, reverse transcriptase, integrase domains in various combinations [Plasmopara halstedii]|eukprot:XP_024581933.1 FOG: Transposon-encoded proteins with TYA, reverse transcriptase, integrase domains in various combinations [Plasmopara halstedii]